MCSDECSRVFSMLMYVPDDNVCHLISSVELLIVNTDNWYDTGYLCEELFICLPQVPEVFDGDGRLAVTLSHADSP